MGVNHAENYALSQIPNKANNKLVNKIFFFEVWLKEITFLKVKSVI